MEREIQLQHDIHNSLDRLNEELFRLEKFNKEMSKFCEENNVNLPNQSRPYVTAEYIKSHIKKTRDALNKYYEDFKKGG